jgi:hypothetical protein
MARIENGFMGGFSGKLGPAIGWTMNGKYYMRARPRKRSVKRSEGEAANQSKFSKMHKWLKPLLFFLREGFKEYTATAKGFNAAKSYNLLNAFVKEGKDDIIDPSRVLVSYGDLEMPQNIRCELNGKALHFSWDTISGYDEHGCDQAMLLAYDPDTRKRNLDITGALKKTGSSVLDISLKGNFHVYIAFVSSDRTRRSNSVYLGRFMVE